MSFWCKLIIQICLIQTCILSFYSFALNTYIVHVEFSATNQNQHDDLESLYQSFIPRNEANSDESGIILYSYKNVFKGFAAKLSPEQVQEMEKISGFLSARPEEVLSLHTTHSPDFLGLHQNMGLWKKSNYGKGVIIGVLDTGILPDHPSFNDEGMPPPPAKWKGKCEFSSTACNNKLIGARVFGDGNGSPADEDGHGTHTASTAAGNYVRGANVFGNANGTAVGVAPLAHLAMYKVCSSFGCSESDILAAMDAAIDDGVDILSLSLGGGSKPFYSDSISLGSYSAIEKGIFVSCSAGNNGPVSTSLSNEAPWVLTVGASTIDRKIISKAVLGNKEVLEGQTLNHHKGFPSTPFPLVYPGRNESDFNARFCIGLTSLDNNVSQSLSGKIVVCQSGGGISEVKKGENVKAVGGVGLILINDVLQGYTILANSHVLPTTHLSFMDGLKVVSYVLTSKLPTASIVFKGTIIGDNKAPAIAFFSSRGPNKASPGILKPDITGPGVNIIAAWPMSIEGNNTHTKSTFNIISGTSMSCPHLSGVAALLKSVHPDWSPAAIKSAIMTTANTMNLANIPIEDESLFEANLFAVGSGHVNPSRATNPGLIYDIQPHDYIPYLCGLNYTDREVTSIVQSKVKCTPETSILEAQLNYPSFSIEFKAKKQTYTRTVTNVGEPNSTYTINIVPPSGFNVTVKPNALRFSLKTQKLTYEVTFNKLRNSENITTSQGSLTWISGKYNVRSPIVANVIASVLV